MESSEFIKEQLRIAREHMAKVIEAIDKVNSTEEVEFNSMEFRNLQFSIEETLKEL